MSTEIPTLRFKKHEEPHGIRYNKAQVVGQSRMRIGQLKQQVIDEELYLAWLEQQPEDWKDE
jgi:hypothetical protein